MKNIILIGMPGAGKSTIGVILAKSMLMDFTDTDLLIQKKYSSSLCNIIEKNGIDEFLKIEKKFKIFESYMDRNDYISVEKIVVDLEKRINNFIASLPIIFIIT